MTTKSEKVLAHHGVKGMHWGVHKDRGSGGSTKPTRAEKKLVKADNRWNNEIQTANNGRVTPAFHNETVTRINRAVDELNSSDKYRHADVNSFQGKLKKDYDRDSNDAIMRAFEDAVRTHYGYSPSGKTRAVYNRKTDKIELHPSAHPQVQHADTTPEDAPVVTLRLIRDSIGRIKSVVFDDTIAQGELLIENFFAHHGVKGMKWGEHKARAQQHLAERRSSTVTLDTTGGKGIVRTRGGAGLEPHEDAKKAKTSHQIAKSSSTDALSTKDLQELVTRMNLEQQYSQLKAKQAANNKSQQMVHELLKEHGPTLAVAGLKKTGHPAALALATGIDMAIKMNSKNQGGGKKKQKQQN